MKRWAVGFYNLFENELTIELVEADDWFMALMQHSKIVGYELPDASLDEAKQAAFDCDAGIDVVEIKP